MTGIIADIQRASVHDGPGLRTTVFLKGCPFHCLWCHNPECISFEPEIMRYPEKCISCGRCSEGCYSGARVVCGREMTPEDVLGVVLEDRMYYGENGGITVSGGEPLAQPEFTAELLRLCRESRVHTAIETTLYRFDEKTLSNVELIMADIKVFDSRLHKEYVGAGNETIIENIKKADELGIPMIIRTPVIPGLNDSRENIKATAEFVKTLRNAVQYELLPYHPLGISKAAALGIESKRFEVPSKKHMEELRGYADIQRQA